MELPETMRLSKYQWTAIVAGLITPALYFLAKSKLQSSVNTIPANPNPINPNNTALIPYQNLKAFLLMIQYSEGTIGANAYHMLYGGALFADTSRHPNRAITRGGITSTAAGAYQILFGTWQSVQQSLRLPDFSPVSQDRAAIELIRRRGALEDVLAGRFAAALYKCRKEWASLPGAGYGQGERSYASLVSLYQRAGGNVITA